MQNGQSFGPYELIKRIAYGGMAEIHLARAKGIGGFEKMLALKVIHPKFSTDQEFIDMLVDEAKIAVQLSHVNIGQIFDLGQIDGTYYIAMEFIDGKDLYQLLVKCSELQIEIPIDVITFIAMEAAAGLQYAHTKADNYGRALNIVHRDISPQNILISYDGEVKIVDFGIAKASQRSKETESGVIKGKFFYMSPEQAWGDNIDARTDIFSAGICLYEMITGEMLYNEDKALALLDKVRKAAIPPMRQKRPDLPLALDGIILKALSRDREQRYQSAGELQRDLSAFLYSNWPDFNRGRLKSFMRQVFGDQRFVLPMPAPGAGPQLSIERQAPRAPEPAPVDLDATGSLMSADEFDPTSGQSVIFDLGRLPSAAAAHDDGDPTVNAVVPLVDDDDDDYEQERTIAEVVWSPHEMPVRTLQPIDEDDDEDATSVIGMGAIDAARALASGGRPDERPTTEEPPTSLFMREGMPMPARAHRPVQPTAGANVPGPTPSRGPVPAPRPGQPSAAAEIPALPPPNMPPMPPGPMPPAPTPIQAPRPIMTSTPAAPAVRPAPAPAAPRPSAPAPQPAPAPAAPSAPKPTAPKPTAPKPSAPKPRKPGNRGAEAGRPTVSVMPSRKKTGLARLFSARGITAMGILALLGVGAFLMRPLFMGKDATASTLTLVVKAVPANATVTLDGTQRATATPARVEGLVPGTQHTQRVEVSGFTPHEETFTVPPEADGNELRRSVFLRKAMGELVLKSEPPGAEVYMDGKYLGDTPLTRKSLDRDKNEVVLLIRKDGFQDRREVLTWGEQTTLEHTVKLTANK